MQITATGIGSGLDIEGLVTQLIAAERQPVENRLNLKEATLQAELSAFGTLKGAVSGLQSSIADVRTLSTFQARQATSSNTDAVTVTATSSAATGAFSVGVTQLAQTHSLASVAFTSTDDVVGEGQLTFRFGTTDYVEGTDTYNSFALNPDSSTLNIAIDSTNNTFCLKTS
ncbi:MAG: flagellar cap protein FliD N-terminal domain-containing protein [Pseudomonadota bacterium]